jgi:hypothetical protein
MISFLANIFRGVSFIMGITAPPPGEDERSFVFLWLGIIVFVAVFVVLLFYAISRIHIS